MKIRLLFIFSLFCLNLNAQEYIWPTNASNYLTSSFAEYRSGHFHAGIDIKTWGREGYKVFAVRDGYIWRIRVSPFGYGKVLYHKLDTGEIVVYAHLQKFNQQIEQIVKREQKRNGEYRINKYFKPDDIPVMQGEVIGYTGSTGIGYPHLHFEIRDPNNRPTNPFLYDYEITDTIPPKIYAISITPLNARSRVNSDVKPLILNPQLVQTGKYKIKQQVLLSGNIGFAVSCYDQANGVNNKYAIYRLEFYVNEELKFSSIYNKFSYSETHLINLERDYRLSKRDLGLFQKLYKQPENVLPFYKPAGKNIGIIRCLPSDKNITNDGVIRDKEPHNYRIELFDFNGNVTVLEGDFIVGVPKQIFSTIETDDEGKYYVTEIIDDKGNLVENPKFYLSSDRGRSWQKALSLQHPNLQDSLNSGHIFSASNSLQILKITSEDEHGLPSFPYFVPLTQTMASTVTPLDIQIEQDFYDDYIRFELSVDGLHREMPRLYVQQMGSRKTEVELVRKDLNHYFGVHQIIPQKDGTVDIEVYAEDLSGKENIFWDQFDIQTITPARGGKMISKDESCRIVFGPDAVYQNLFLRMNEASILDTNRYEFIGNAYRVEPQDVPLKKSATIYLTYPANDSLPEKLGVYGSYDLKRWGFNGNRLDRENNTISTRLSSLRFVTLIRDTIPPEINILSPRNGATLTQKYPTIKARVRDRLSGIASERSIVVKLDGQKVIAEYDPERRTVTYEVEEPLAAGKHTVEVWAVDNSGNENGGRSGFNIAGN